MWMIFLDGPQREVDDVDIAVVIASVVERGTVIDIGTADNSIN